MSAKWLPVLLKNGFNFPTMHPAIIIGTVRSLCTWLWCRCHIPQNIFLVMV